MNEIEILENDEFVYDLEGLGLKDNFLIVERDKNVLYNDNFYFEFQLEDVDKILNPNEKFEGVSLKDEDEMTLKFTRGQFTEIKKILDSHK